MQVIATGFVIFIVITMVSAKLPMEVVSFMNTSVNPCHNFYQYSCGGWLSSSVIKPTEIRQELYFDQMNERNERVIEAIVKEKHPLVHDFWNSCLLEQNGNKMLQKDIKRIVNAKSSAELMSLAGEFARTGTHAFVKFDVGAGFEDASTHVLFMKTGDLALPSEDMYTRDEFQKISNEYKEYINKLIKLSGFPMTTQRSAADIVIAIEQKLASVKAHGVHEIVPLPIVHVAKNLPRIFDFYSNGIGLFKKTQLTKHDKIYIENLKYMDTLEEWLAFFPIDSIKVYLAFMMVHSRVEWLGQDFYQIWFKFFSQKLKGQQEVPSRNTICKEHLILYLPDLIGKYYYEKAFDTSRAGLVVEMVEMIKQSMRDRLRRTNWLYGKDKEKAINKVNALKALIGQTTMPKSYPRSLSRRDYYANLHKLLGYEFDQQLKKVGERVNRLEWEVSAAKIDAYNLRTGNTLILPAGILQPPYFAGRNVHPARNFGAIGMTIGHELMHGIDSYGYQYDVNGNLAPWWSEATLGAFNARGQCLEAKYSDFEVVDTKGVIKKVQGELTLRENIADSGGLALSWDAYRKFMSDFHPNTRGLTEKEGDKLFFIVYGQSMCEKTRDEYRHYLLQTSDHSPGEWRVNGAIMNNNAFASVFDCEANAPMNPVEKCELW